MFRALALSVFFVIPMLSACPAPSEGEGEGGEGEGEGGAGEGEGEGAAGEGEGEGAAGEGEGEGAAGEGEGEGEGAGEGEGEGEGEGNPADACTTPLVAASGDNAGDTTQGTALLIGEPGCLDDLGGKEQVWLFTPAHDGELAVTLTSAHDLGFTVRSACPDDTTNLGDAQFGATCMDFNPGGQTENGTYVVSAPVFIVVDTFDPTDAGAYTLNVTFTPSVCGDGNLTGTEQCDGANLNGAVCSDVLGASSGTLACTNTCTFDTTQCVSQCTTARTAALGDNTGDTTTGVAAVSTGCQGAGGKDDIWTFTPATTGFVRATLASASDQGVSARSTCALDASELGCADRRATANEVLSVPAIAGTPITLVVQPDTSGNEGPYTLTLANTALTEVEPNDNPPIDVNVLGTSYTGFINGVGDQDCVSVAATLGQTITATVTDDGTGLCTVRGLDSLVIILDTDALLPLVENDDIDQQAGNLCSEATTQVGAAGTYFVCVASSPNPQPFGDVFEYGLTVTVQ